MQDASEQAVAGAIIEPATRVLPNLMSRIFARFHKCSRSHQRQVEFLPDDLDDMQIHHTICAQNFNALFRGHIPFDQSFIFFHWATFLTVIAGMAVPIADGE